MTRDKQKQIFDAFVSKQWDIMDSKAKDYANDDRLSNFKRVGSMCGTSPEMAIMHLIATKVARLTELFSGKTPNNESVEDSILDLANYTILLQMAREERKPQVKSAEMLEKWKLQRGFPPEPKEQSPLDKLKKRIMEENLRLVNQKQLIGEPLSKASIEGSWIRKGLAELADCNKDGGNCPTESIKLPKAKLQKKKKKKNVLGEGPLGKIPSDRVVTFKADSMEDAVKQLEAMGIKIPNGMMLGCMQVK
jgi:hypothetical protein